MPTSWIAALAGVVVLAASGAMVARARRGRAQASAGDSRPRAAGDEAHGRNAAVLPVEAGAALLASEYAILEQLCARAVAGLPARPLASAHAAGEADAAAVEVLSGIRAHPRFIPRRPQLLPQLTRAINDPFASAHSIAAILGQDPALAGNLLRIANSALYRRRGAPIEHLERAVTLLGTEGLRQTVMAALLQPVITDDGSVFSRCAAALWEHTLRTAGIAATTRGASRDDQHAAQLLALLHGLGSVVVVQVLRDAWGRLADGDPEPGRLVAMLDAWSLRCARAVSADWGLSARVQQALDDLADGHAGDGLGMTVRASRAAALASAASAATPTTSGPAAP